MQFKLSFESWYENVHNVTQDYVMEPAATGSPIWSWILIVNGLKFRALQDVFARSVAVLLCCSGYYLLPAHYIWN